MVDTTARAEEVIVGAGGLIEAAQPSDLVISMSTIDPTAVQKDAQEARRERGRLINAPISGMEQRAKLATLKAFVGGDALAIQKAQPVLKVMVAEVIHLGPIGQGLVMKLVNNMLAQVGRIAVIEALVLGAKAGLGPQTMVDVIGHATGNSVAFQYTAYLRPRVVSRDFDGIRMDITDKDLELQTALAKSLSVPLFLATICQKICQMGRAAGLGGEDGAAIVKIYEQMTGAAVAST